MHEAGGLLLCACCLLSTFSQQVTLQVSQQCTPNAGLTISMHWHGGACESGKSASDV
jgi:hypothetical protein